MIGGDAAVLYVGSWLQFVSYNSEASETSIWERGVRRTKYFLSLNREIDLVLALGVKSTKRNTMID